jgi:hypothetical protein
MATSEYSIYRMSSGLQIPFREKGQSSMHKQEFENVWLCNEIIFQ